MTSSYKAFCRLERRHFRTCSYFFVSCFSTSLLVLLRINGCVTWREDTTHCFLSVNDIITHPREPLHLWGGGDLIAHWGPMHRSRTYPVQAYDHFVVVVLVLLIRGFQREVQVGPGEARDEEVHHGPQLQEGIVQGRVDQEQALLAAHKPETMCESPRHGKLGRRC